MSLTPRGFLEARPWIVGYPTPLLSAYIAPAPQKMTPQRAVLPYI
jgi:hypothetical protein